MNQKTLFITPARIALLFLCTPVTLEGKNPRCFNTKQQPGEKTMSTKLLRRWPTTGNCNMATETGNTYISKSMTCHRNYDGNFGKPRFFDHDSLEDSVPMPVCDCNNNLDCVKRNRSGHVDIV